MAVPVVASSATNSVNNGTSVVITKPSGTVDDDLLVAVFTKELTTAFGNAPTGWTILRNGAKNGTGRSWVAYKLASSEGTNYTWDWTGNEDGGGRIYRVTGVDTTTPVDQSSSWNEGTSNNPVASTLTTDDADNLVFAIHTADGVGLSGLTADTGWNLEHSESYGSGGDRSSQLTETKEVDSAASGNTAPDGGGGTYDWGCLQLAAQPTAAGPQTITGSLLTRSPTFPTGAVNATNTISGDNRYLDLPGTNGHFASTPDHASLDITGDVDLRAYVALDWDSVSAYEPIVWKVASGQRSYWLTLAANNSLEMSWSIDGSAQIIEGSTVDPGATLADGDFQWVRATLDVDNDASGYDVKFYLGGFDRNNPVWVQLGATVVGGATTSIFSGTAALLVGADGFSSNWLKGLVGIAQVYDGIDGTLVADFDAADFTVGDTDTDTAVGSAGKTWTIDGTSSFIKDAVLVRSPTFPTGTVTPGNVTLTGVLLSRSPTFPIGDLPFDVVVDGVLLSRSPTFPTGSVVLAGADTGMLAHFATMM